MFVKLTVKEMEKAQGGEDKKQAPTGPMRETLTGQQFGCTPRDPAEGFEFMDIL